VADPAGIDTELFRIDLQPLRRCGNKHFARSGAHAAHQVVKGFDALAVAREHPVVLRMPVGRIE